VQRLFRRYQNLVAVIFADSPGPVHNFGADYDLGINIKRNIGHTALKTENSKELIGSGIKSRAADKSRIVYLPLHFRDQIRPYIRRGIDHLAYLIKLAPLQSLCREPNGVSLHGPVYPIARVGVVAVEKGIHPSNFVNHHIDLLFLVILVSYLFPAMSHTDNIGMFFDINKFYALFPET
jgi:hypothetical protein